MFDSVPRYSRLTRYWIVAKHYLQVIEDYFESACRGGAESSARGAQKDAQSAASQPAEVLPGSSESSSQKQQEEQEDATLPPAEENGLDQTAKLHAVRLYTEW